MNKIIVKTVSVTMALILMLCTFAGCGDETKYEQDPDFVPQTTEPITEGPEENPENIFFEDEET